MVDVSSIVVAIIALVGSVGAALFTFTTQFYSDERKRLAEAEKLLRKYRDPLFWAADDLQSRFWNICNTRSSLIQLYHDEGYHDFVVIYTAYLIGQYFGWVHILRRQVQFYSVSASTSNERTVYRLMWDVSTLFLKDGQYMSGGWFMLWKGHQNAIGEIMTVRDESKDLFVMGYATFQQKWKKDEEFRAWFRPVEDGLYRLAKAERRYRHCRSESHEAFTEVREDVAVLREQYHIVMVRLMYLQHLLLEMMELLDSKGEHWNKAEYKRVELSGHQSQFCRCTPCKVEQASLQGRAIKGEKEQV